jgi:mRNA-degrading endonuclease toxin of MazEF toxin-antitoxin module
VKQGDIVLVPFPHADSDESELHPAVVIAEVPFGNSSDIILSMISSNIPKCTSDDVLINNDDPEFPVTKLKYSSCVKTAKIATISNNRIRHQLGRLGPNKNQEFTQKLKKRLAL